MPTKSTALLFEVDAIAGTRRKKRIRISISSPYLKEPGMWACLFELSGSKEEAEKHEYFGVDGFLA